MMMMMMMNESCMNACRVTSWHSEMAENVQVNIRIICSVHCG
jgi:hypothetical protein